MYILQQSSAIEFIFESTPDEKIYRITVTSIDVIDESAVFKNNQAFDIIFNND